MINIYLDDERPTPEGWLRANNVSECISLLTEHRDNVEILSLDWYLGWDAPHGDEVLTWLEAQFEAGYSIPKFIYVHTASAEHSRLMRFRANALRRAHRAKHEVNHE